MKIFRPEPIPQDVGIDIFLDDCHEECYCDCDRCDIGDCPQDGVCAHDS